MMRILLDEKGYIVMTFGMWKIVRNIVVKIGDSGQAGIQDKEERRK